MPSSTALARCPDIRSTGTPSAVTNPPRLRLLQQVRDAVRRKHSSPRTEETDVHWIRRFIHFGLHRARRSARAPSALTRAEAAALLERLRGHRSVSTTMIYTHVMNKGGRGARSPLDRAEQSLAEYTAA